MTTPWTDPANAPKETFAAIDFWADAAKLHLDDIKAAATRIEMYAAQEKIVYDVSNLQLTLDRTT